MNQYLPADAMTDKYVFIILEVCLCLFVGSPLYFVLLFTVMSKRILSLANAWQDVLDVEMSSMCWYESDSVEV